MFKIFITTCSLIISTINAIEPTEKNTKEFITKNLFEWTLHWRNEVNSIDYKKAKKLDYKFSVEEDDYRRAYLINFKITRSGKYPLLYKEWDKVYLEEKGKTKATIEKFKYIVFWLDYTKLEVLKNKSSLIFKSSDHEIKREFIKGDENIGFNKSYIHYWNVKFEDEFYNQNWIQGRWMKLHQDYWMSKSTNLYLSSKTKYKKLPPGPKINNEYTYGSLESIEGVKSFEMKVKSEKLAERLQNAFNFLIKKAKEKAEAKRQEQLKKDSKTDKDPF